jgi:hypothetical protein
MALIGFHCLHGGHSGKSMASAVIDRAGIMTKVNIFQCSWHTSISFLIFFKAGHFKMNNASTNLTMMKEIKIMLNEHDIDFDAIDRHIRGVQGSHFLATY